METLDETMKRRNWKKTNKKKEKKHTNPYKKRTNRIWTVDASSS